MRIFDCPSCHAKFRLDDSQLFEGVRVLCPNCKRMFRLGGDQLLPIGAPVPATKNRSEPEIDIDLDKSFANLDLDATVADQDEGESDDLELVRRILVVEDDEAIREFLESALAKQGHVVITAKDGLDALEAIEDGVPDLIVSDIDMPRMSGIELCEAIRNRPHTRMVPIILLTGQHQSELIREAKSLGVAHFLPKPIRFKTLLAYISAALSED